MSISTCTCICTYLFVLCSLCVYVFMKSKGQHPVLSTGMLFICFELNIKWFPVSVSPTSKPQMCATTPFFLTQSLMIKTRFSYFWGQYCTNWGTSSNPSDCHVYIIHSDASQPWGLTYCSQVLCHWARIFAVQ